MTQPDNSQFGGLPLAVYAPDIELSDVAHVSDLLTRELPQHGAVLFRGFNIDTEERFQKLVQSLSGSPLEYSERSSPRTRLQGNIYTSTDYPSEYEIFLHNENSYQTRWPLRLHFCCFQPPKSLGATPLADTRQVYQRIDPALAKEFEARGWQVVRNFHEGLGVRWQDAFGAESEDAVNEYCSANRIETEWLAGGQLRTRTHRRAVHRHPVTGEATWFNHATFFHVTTLPADISEALRALYSADDLPTNTYFGDGSDIPADALDHLRECYRAETTRFSWEQGDVLIVDNMNVAHGRESYTGARRIGVAMTAPHGNG